MTAVCTVSGGCSGGQTCCLDSCCGSGQLCCTVTNVTTMTGCMAPVNGTCPQGNPQGVCADPDTPIATPRGYVPIAELRPGDLVYSVERGAVVVVPISRTMSRVVSHHQVLHLVLDNGESLDISPSHPTADGRRLGEVGAGTQLSGVTIREVSLIPYRHERTYDILPASDSGSYFAAGMLVGSTLGGLPDNPAFDLAPN